MRSQAVNIYYWVRDQIRYNPYLFSADPTHLQADKVIVAGAGWCVPKAILMAALCRAQNIPAALGFADVRNHLSTARMRAQMNTDVFYYHGYCAVFLDGEWVKATPAFNPELCEKFGLRTLEFDGLSDSLYHPFDLTGQRHMEYLQDRGQFADVPVEDMYACFREAYGDMMQEEGDWDADVAAETATSR